MPIITRSQATMKRAATHDEGESHPIAAKIRKVAMGTSILHFPDCTTNTHQKSTRGQMPAPPVFAGKTLFAGKQDFTGQADVDRHWSAFQDLLMRGSLSESEVLDVLQSGVLHDTDTGKKIAQPFAEAMMRSIVPIGRLGPVTSRDLKVIVNAVCSLPPTSWMSEFGDIWVQRAKDCTGVEGFIQAQLDNSVSKQRTRDADQSMPAERVESTAWEWVTQRSWLEAIRGCSLPSLESLKSEVTANWGTLKTMFGHSKDAVPGRAPFGDGAPTVLSYIQAFERSADFYSSVVTTGPRPTNDPTGNLLYALHALSTIGLAQRGTRHISTARPTEAPSTLAWKNGSYPLPASTSQPPPGDVDTVSSSLWQLAAHVDEVASMVSRTLMPWSDAHALSDELLEVTAYTPVYQSTTAPIGSLSYLPEMDAVRDQLYLWLGWMSAKLISSGVAVISTTGDLVERNPGRAVAAFTTYVGLYNFFTQWFLPDSREADAAFTAPLSEPDAETDLAFETHERVIQEFTDLLEDLPEFRDWLEQRISQSPYLDPGEDFQLIEDVRQRSQQWVPGSAHVNYQDFWNEAVQAVTADVREEQGDEPADVATDTIDTDMHTGRRVKREVYVATPSMKLSDMASSIVPFLIEASSQMKAADTPGSVEGEVIPGSDIDQALDQFIGAFNDVQASDPAYFVVSFINQTIENSNLAENVKSTLTYKTQIPVVYTVPKRLWDNYESPFNYKVESFDLAQLFCGKHHKLNEYKFSIKWPDGCTPEFIANVEEADLQQRYTAHLQDILSRPQVADLWKLNKKNELEREIKWYLERTDISSEGRGIATAFLKGKAVIRPIRIADGVIASPFSHAPEPVGNAIYLSHKSGPGLFVFLGENSTVIEYPADLFYRKKSIEQFPELSELLSSRVTLKSLQARGEGDFKYSLGRSSVEVRKPGWLEWIGLLPQFVNPGTPAVATMTLIKPIVRLPYEPILFDSSRSHEGVLDELFNRQITQMLSDIDTLISTSTERITDLLLEATGLVLALASLCVGIIPQASFVIKGLAMMLGVGSSATDLVRSHLEDDPQIAQQLEGNALRGALMEIVGPFVGKRLRKVLSDQANSQLGSLAIERLSRFSAQVPTYIKKILDSPAAKPLFKRTRKLKWINPVVSDFLSVQERINRKFIKYQVVNKLNRLSRGPKVAQRLMDQTGVTYFAGPEKGYVYRGFLMRGDMRAPEKVFKEGFKLRTPVTDISQINGMKGGFGGGKNALDPDGMGISTSPFYKEAGAGAYHYGGARGGYTYLIDGRDIDGFHLYQNHLQAQHPGLKMPMTPYEINVGSEIPSSKILGAYDSKGVFTPNPSALNASIRNSTPAPLLGAAPTPKKLVIDQRNITSSQHRPF
jgi:hypothetical protein